MSKANLFGLLAAISAFKLLASLPATAGEPGRATALTAFQSRVCALINSRARCIGGDLHGESGRRSQTTTKIGEYYGREDSSETAPSKKNGPDLEFLEIAAGANHVCGLLKNRDVVCWGKNTNGQLGIDIKTLDGPDRPDHPWARVALGTEKKALHIYAGFNSSCAMLMDRTVKCWGDNNQGQLGLGDQKSRGAAGTMGDNLPPIDLGRGRTIVDFSMGELHSCAVLDDGTVKCWGYGGEGRLGNGIAEALSVGVSPTDLGDNLKPVNLGRVDAVQVSAGDAHTCVLFKDGGAKCWGLNNSGQLGLGDTRGRGMSPDDMGKNLPLIELDSSLVSKSIRVGARGSCVHFINGTAACWGNNSVNQLGINDYIDRGIKPGDLGENLSSIDLGPFASVVEIIPDASATCALLRDGQIKCWGNLDFMGTGKAYSYGQISRVQFIF